MWDFFFFYFLFFYFFVLFLVLQDILKLDFDWGSIFEPFPYTKKYTRFVKIYLSATKKDELGDWVGWVKSRFRCLLVKVCGSYRMFIVFIFI
jgi:poly(A) polymerase